jgi:LSD1 subclass zinc finger protein
MAVQIICPNLACRKILSVPDEVRGKQVKCQHCQTNVRVPEMRRPAVAAGAGPANGKK